MGMYSSDELDNIHNEAQEGSSYEDIYGETYEQSCANYSPWQAEQDAMDYEFNARFDYISEAYGAEARALAQQAEMEAYYDALDDGSFTGTYAEWKSNQSAKLALRLLTEINDELPF